MEEKKTYSPAEQKLFDAVQQAITEYGQTVPSTAEMLHFKWEKIKKKFFFSREETEALQKQWKEAANNVKTE